jgi:MFS family permease
MVKMTVAQGAETLEGFKAREALRTRSFWMIVVAKFCFGLAAAGAVIHLVAYLEGIGYTGESAALAMSLIFGSAALGKILMGFLADRVTARIALALDFALIAIGLTLVFGAARVAVIVIFVVAFGTLAGAPLILLPLLVAESLGRQRYGFLEALTGVAATFGAMVGPVVAGRIFDVTGSYTVAFELFIVVNVIGALAVFTCQSYATEDSLRRIAPADASA